MLMEKNAASFTNVKFAIVHAVKGRVRLRFSGDFARELLPKIVDRLRQQAGVLAVQIKQPSNSLVVTFVTDAISVEQLTDSLQSCGLIPTANQAIAEPTNDSSAVTYSRLFSLIPPLVGIVIARSLQVSGWKSILTYILAAGVTREVIDVATGESEEVESSPIKPVSKTEVATEEISTLLTAIETEYEIVHQIPGRIRLRVPKISCDRNYGQELKHLLEKDQRISDVRLKINSSSVVISYDRDAVADFQNKKLNFNERNGHKVIQTDESENSTPSNQQETEIKSDVNDRLPPGDGSASKQVLSTSHTETETKDNLPEETESTTPISEEESETETNQEFTNQQIITNAGYWSDFKSSMLWTMLELMGNLQVQTVDI